LSPSFFSSKAPPKNLRKKILEFFSVVDDDINKIPFIVVRFVIGVLWGQERGRAFMAGDWHRDRRRFSIAVQIVPVNPS